jgi:hypothetical protein
LSGSVEDDTTSQYDEKGFDGKHMAMNGHNTRRAVYKNKFVSVSHSVEGKAQRSTGGEWCAVSRRYVQAKGDGAPLDFFHNDII